LKLLFFIMKIMLVVSGLVRYIVLLETVEIELFHKNPVIINVIASNCNIHV
jgi:hypothetical protein